MNYATIKLAIFTRDLLSVDESLIILGRTNMREDFNNLQIVIDIISSSQVETTSRKFKDTDEIMDYANTQKALATINFFGDGAYNKANEFLLKCRSQKSRDLQREHYLRIGIPTTIRDIKQLTGVQYSEQYEIEISLTHSEEISIDTLRIDYCIPEVMFNK